MHLRRQLAYDIWFQLLAWFLICIIERGKLVAEQPGFNAFNILFEVTSAYGTVGLSTGVPYDDYSLSGAFQAGSKIVMLAVMIRGRHPGLPLAIDRSILLPGEDPMHKMDRDYNEYGEIDPRDEAEVQRHEELSGKKNLPDGKGAEQDPSDIERTTTRRREIAQVETRVQIRIIRARTSRRFSSVDSIISTSEFPYLDLQTPGTY
jgi:hypothetical protein